METFNKIANATGARYLGSTLTKMFIQIVISIATILLPLLMTAIPFAADPYNKETKRITGAGVLFIIFGALSSLGAWYEKSTNNSESKNLHSDIYSLRQETHQRDSVDKASGVSYNENTKKLIVIDSAILSRVEIAVPPDEKPTVIVGEADGFNPVFNKTSDSQYVFVLSISTSSGIVATNLRNKYYRIYVQHGIAVKIDSTDGFSLNKDIILSKSPSLRMKFYTTAQTLPDTIIHFIKVRYTNKNGKEQEPFRKIFITTPNDIDKAISELQSNQYEAFKKAFIKTKLWQ